MDNITELFEQIQEIVEELDHEELPIEIFKDIPEELQEYTELYHELDDAIANFFVECIKQQPYGSTNDLLRECIAFLRSKGITGQMVDQLFSPADVESYNWDHSFLFLSLGSKRKIFPHNK
jgi:hypothetical protein